jgi:hypothetical protein
MIVQDFRMIPIEISSVRLRDETHSKFIARHPRGLLQSPLVTWNPVFFAVGPRVVPDQVAVVDRLSVFAQILHIAYGF